MSAVGSIPAAHLPSAQPHLTRPRSRSCRVPLVRVRSSFAILAHAARKTRSSRQLRLSERLDGHDRRASCARVAILELAVQLRHPRIHSVGREPRLDQLELVTEPVPRPLAPNDGVAASICSLRARPARPSAAAGDRARRVRVAEQRARPPGRRRRAAPPQDVRAGAFRRQYGMPPGCWRRQRCHSGSAPATLKQEMPPR